jgi:hypothetical protein
VIMPTPWNDIEILQVVDSPEHDYHANGLALMQRVAARRRIAIAEPNYETFVRELFVLRGSGLLTWNDDMGPGHVAPANPHNPLDYLQGTRQFVLTVRGRDRARAQIVHVPLPDPDEDDGRMIRGSTLEDIASIIGSAYTFQQAIRFLGESGISLEQLPETDARLPSELVSHVLETLAEGTSGQRRELRGVLGAWLDGELHSGPDQRQYEAIVADLGRQGWFVRDGRLVIGESVRGRAVGPAATAAIRAQGRAVFIGHGHSPLWRELKDFIADRLALPWDEFNRVSPAGITHTARLETMLDAAGIAFLVLTAEDEQTDGRVLARQNVVHEAGLFQGRLGFTRALVVLEEGCEEFSNIHGLGQIRFPAGNIAAKFAEMWEVLEREGFVTPPRPTG